MTPEFQDIMVIEVLHEELNWSSGGGGGFHLPLKLSGAPDELWTRTFRNFCRDRFSSLLKCEARIHGDQLILGLSERSGITHEVFEIKRVVDAVNEDYKAGLVEREREKREAEDRQRQRDVKIEELRQEAKNLKI